MFLRKYMSLFGIGTATVALHLNKEAYRLTEDLDGAFFISGGTTVQKLKRIEYELIALDSKHQEEVVVETMTIFTSRTIEPNESFSYPFRYCIPAHVLLLYRIFRFRTRLYFMTGSITEEHNIIPFKK